MKHEFITKWQKQLSESQRSEFELDVYKYLTSEQPEINPIEKAYEEGVKIRSKTGKNAEWYKKYWDGMYIDNKDVIKFDYNLRQDLKENPEKWELYPEPEAQPEPAKPELNPIEQAYEDWVKIRQKKWEKHCWIKKHSETKTVDNNRCLSFKWSYNFKTNPEQWEIYNEAEAKPEPAKSETEPTPSNKPEMTYAEKAKYIIENKLTHKDALVKNCYAYYRDCDIFHFYDENWKLMFTQRFPTLDLSEWIPFQPKFDRNRFEAMFRAVLVCESYPNAIKATEEILQQLDAYYASKEGGNHEN